MQKSDTIKELAAALAKAQSEMKNAVKDTANPFFKSRYADLASVFAACREALTKNGIAVTQPTVVRDERMYIETVLMHSSGEWVSGEYPVKPVKDDPQALGSATTYARRYALAAMVGVAQDDDDGEAAAGRTKKPSAGDTTKYSAAIDAAKSVTELDAIGSEIGSKLPPSNERTELSKKFNDKRKQLTQ